MREITDTTTGETVLVDEASVNCVADRRGQRHVELPERTYVVADALESFRDWGFVLAVHDGPDGQEGYAINPAAVASVEPSDGCVHVLFARPGYDTRLVVREYAL